MQPNQLMVVYGDNPQAMVEALLQKIKPEEGLLRTAKIGLKPNLVLDKPASSGATTHPEMVAGIIKYFQVEGTMISGLWKAPGWARRRNGLFKSAVIKS